jgi:hypothetical protein
MFSEILNNINGLNIISALSLISFLAVFTMILIAVWKLDKNFINKMQNLPLEKENLLNNIQERE